MITSFYLILHFTTCQPVDLSVVYRYNGFVNLQTEKNECKTLIHMFCHMSTVLKFKVHYAICTSIHPYINSFIHPFIRISLIHPFIHPFIHPSIYPSIIMCIIHPSTICPPITHPMLTSIMKGSIRALLSIPKGVYLKMANTSHTYPLAASPLF